MTNTQPDTQPLTDIPATARYYRDRLGWPVGFTRSAVWLHLSAPLIALAVPEPIASRIAITGPAIKYPTDPAYRVFLTSSLHPANGDMALLFRACGIVQLTDGCFLDLPPTKVIPGPLTWGRDGSLTHLDSAQLTWASVPESSDALASFTAIAEALRGDATAS